MGGKHQPIDKRTQAALDDARLEERKNQILGGAASTGGKTRARKKASPAWLISDRPAEPEKPEPRPARVASRPFTVLPPAGNDDAWQRALNRERDRQATDS